MANTGYTILVVEDDREVRALAVELLESAGYRVLEAGSGDEAVQLLAAHPDLPIDVLFTDVVMPGRRDGIDLAIAARALRPRIKILFATGFADLVRPNRSADIEGPVLHKPYRPGALYREIAALLRDDEPG